MSLLVPDAGSMDALGCQLLHPASWRGVVWLQGDLGAGKTTLVRSLLRGLGYTGRVKSPTYTLLELGIRDLLTDNDLLLVEWPERGRGVLPEPDLEIVIDYEGEGRRISALANSPLGKQMLASLPSLESEITP
jgi:tRNA threonylcarbamoyladenosine biosynthesis protein TsaE